MNLITSVDLDVNGLPLSPPSSFLFTDFKLSLLMVVLVAIIPSNPVSLTIEIMSSNWLLFKSGAILSKIGLGLVLLRLIEIKELINFVSGSFC